MTRWDGPRIGFQSYDKDPTLRQHIYGRIEPMDYPQKSSTLIRLITGVGLLIGILWGAFG